MPGERALAALTRDDGGDALVLQPAKEPVQLRAQDLLVGEAGEEYLERVEEDALGADGVDGVGEADEETVQVVVARLLDLRAVEEDVVDDELLLLDESRQVEAERRHVGRQLVPPLLEGEDGARLAVLGRATDEELEPEDGLAAAGAAADKRGTTAGQATGGELVEPGYACQRLRHSGRRLGAPRYGEALSNGVGH